MAAVQGRKQSQDSPGDLLLEQEQGWHICAAWNHHATLNALSYVATVATAY